MSEVFVAKDRYGSETEFELVEPNSQAETEAEMRYRVAYSAALREGILPRESMREMLKEQGIWTEANEKEYNSVLIGIARSTEELDRLVKSGDIANGRDVASKLAKDRTRMYELFAVQQSSFLNSCEGYAELVKTESLRAACVVIKANGERYWKTYADYVMERDENPDANVAEQMAEVVVRQLEAENQDFLKELPEQQWIQRLREEPTPKKKRKRSKKSG